MISNNNCKAFIICMCFFGSRGVNFESADILSKGSLKMLTIADIGEGHMEKITLKRNHGSNFKTYCRGVGIKDWMRNL